MTFDLDADALKVYKKRYRAKIRETAAAVRRIFVILAERKLLESTIVIVSRWGSSMITHSFGKLDDREATHRVPLLLWFPATYGLSRVATLTDSMLPIALSPTLSAL